MSRLLILSTAITLTACSSRSSNTERASFAPFDNGALQTIFAFALRIATSLPGASVVTTSNGTTQPAAPATLEPIIAHKMQTQPATLTVLHIEDNPQEINAMRRIFASLQHLTLLEARTGEFGIKLATANPPALILLDMTLPGINGSEVLRRLRSHPATRNVPVVAVTRNSSALGIELDLGGFDDYLAKPVDAARVQTVLNRRIGDTEKELFRPATIVKQ